MVLLLIGLIFSNQATASADIVEKHYGCPNSTYLCKALTANHDRDSDGCRVSPRHVGDLAAYMDQQGDKSQSKNVSGKIRYVGPVTGRYAYDLIRVSKNKMTLRAQVHFSNLAEFSAAEIRSYEAKIKSAARVWKKNSPFGSKIDFNFVLSRRPSRKLASPKLIRQNTRGPYFSQWSLGWSVDTIAHEFGHIMGLFDEYSYSDNDTSNCSARSIMCHSHRGDPLGYHYQLIFQRAFCKVKRQSSIGNKILGSVSF